MKRSAGMLLLHLVAALAGVLAAVEGVRLSAQQPQLLYVCVQDDAKVVVIDMAARKALRTVDFQKLGFTATAKPHYIVVEPDGSHWYVSLIGANRVLKMDRQDRIAAQYEMETPGMLALATRDRLVVTRSMSAVNPPKRIAVVDRKTMKGEEYEVLFARPHPVAATSRGFAYTGSLGVNQIATIDLTESSGAVVKISSLPGPIHSFVQFAATRDGKTLVATGDASGQLLVLDVGGTPAEKTPTLVKAIDVGKMAFDPVFTPDEKFVWVPVKSTDSITIVDATDWKMVKFLRDTRMKQPHQIVFSSDGATAFVTNNNKVDHMADPAHAGHEMAGANDVASLLVVDVKSLKVEAVLPLGKNLTGMGTAHR